MSPTPGHYRPLRSEAAGSHPPPGWRGIAMRYGLAIASSAVAFAIASLIRRPVVELSPFLLFYAAVAVSSWYGGFGPGMLAVALGSLVADYSLFEPRDS